jgi:hypothetical protein
MTDEIVNVSPEGTTEAPADVSQGEVIETTTADVSQGDTTEGVSFALPEEYQDRGWASKVGSQDDLYKLLDNSQKLIGKKNAFPAEDASDEERAEFKQKLTEAGYLSQAPESYEFAEIEGLTIPDNVTDKFSAIARDLNLSNEDANTLRQRYITEVEIPTAQERNEAMEADFQQKIEAKYGDAWADKVASATTVLKQHMTDASPESLQKIPNDALLALVDMVDSMKPQADNAPSNSGSHTLDAGQAKKRFTEARENAKNKPFDKQAQQEWREAQEAFRQAQANG